MSQTRCEFTELIVEQCAHCRGSRDPDIESIDPLEDSALNDTHDEHFYKAFPAPEKAGKCGLCGDPIQPGEMIIPNRYSEFGGYRHEECP